MVLLPAATSNTMTSSSVPPTSLVRGHPGCPYATSVSRTRCTRRHVDFLGSIFPLVILGNSLKIQQLSHSLLGAEFMNPPAEDHPKTQQTVTASIDSNTEETVASPSGCEIPPAPKFSAPVEPGD